MALSVMIAGTSAMAYLNVIERHPDAVIDALQPAA